MTHHIASSQQKLVRRQGIGASRGARAGQHVPVGEMHAVADGDPLTYCGRSVSSLYDFPDMTFDMDVDDRCPECNVGAGLWSPAAG